MRRVRRPAQQLLLLLASLPLLVVASAVLYQFGMGWLEGEQRTFWEAVGFAGETLSTTGYGADMHWNNPVMVLFVVALQFVGVFLIFLIFPIVLIPLLEQRFETRLPHLADKGLSDHLVVYGYGPAVATLIEHAEARGLPTLVVEEDEATARRLDERGVRVIHSHFEDGALAAARLEHARALVANSSDEANAAIVLGARQNGFTGDILVLVEEPLHRRPLILAGATAAFTPRHVLGAALAARASDRIQAGVAGIQQVGRLQVHQVRVQTGSSLAGVTLRDAGIGARTGAVVIGQWVGGRLEPTPTAETVIEPGGMLVIAGTDDSVRRLVELATGAVRLRRHGRYLVGGFGEVGKKVEQLLTDAGEELAIRERTGCSIVGVERGEDVFGDLAGDFLFEPGDTVYVCGPSAAVDRFLEVFRG